MRGATALKLQANKTDRNDAFGLARLVHSGWYEPVAIKSFDRYRNCLSITTMRSRFMAVSPLCSSENDDRAIDGRRHCARTDRLGWFLWIMSRLTCRYNA